jgi:Ca-activated chloride channel family protein
VPATWRVRLRGAPAGLRWLALAGLAVALAGPTEEAVEREVVRPGLDVLLLIDVSQSMRARDGAPDRLGSALQVARRLVPLRPRDRFGILLFAGEHAIACPLTGDHRAVLDRLSSIEAAASDAGTAFGPAIVGGLGRLRAARSANGVLIALTDGTTNAGTPLPEDAARLAARDGVAILTVGAGRGGLVPFPTELGMVEVPLGIDEGVLQGLASATHGTFVRADAPGAHEMLRAALDRLEPQERVLTERRVSPVLGWLGTAAMIAVMLELALAGMWLRSWS